MKKEVRKNNEMVDVFESYQTGFHVQSSVKSGGAMGVLPAACKQPNMAGQVCLPPTGGYGNCTSIGTCKPK